MRLSFLVAIAAAGLMAAVLTAQTRSALGTPLAGVTPVEFEEFRLGLEDFLEVEASHRIWLKSEYFSSKNRVRGYKKRKVSPVAANIKKYSLRVHQCLEQSRSCSFVTVSVNRHVQRPKLQI